MAREERVQLLVANVVAEFQPSITLGTKIHKNSNILVMLT